MRLSDGLVASATWGARCGKSARRVLSGGTGARRHAGSVRPRSRKGPLWQGSAKAIVPRPVPTSHTLKHEWLVRFIEHAGPQPSADEFEDSGVGDAMCKHPQQPLVIDRVEEATDVRVEDPIHILRHERRVQRS